jgi:hypothetical protein
LSFMKPESMGREREGKRNERRPTFVFHCSFSLS